MKTKRFDNGLTPAQTERLVYLMEECGEVIQAAAKILRHGYESCAPDDLHRTPNRVQLVKELADVRTAEFLLSHKGDVSDEQISDEFNRDFGRSGRHMHHQNPEGERRPEDRGEIAKGDVVRYRNLSYHVETVEPTEHRWPYALGASPVLKVIASLEEDE